MKTIYLLSGPGTTKGYTKEIIKKMKEDLKDANSISFIASSPDNHEKNMKYVFGNDEVVGIINHLKEVKTFDKINLIDNSNIDKEALINSDIIYLLGGDTKSQLEFIKNNKIDLILKDYKGIILGTSCGAMNIATDSYYSKDEDYDKSFFYKGIGLIDITIDPHFDINNEEQVNEAKNMSFAHKIYGVPNDSCIRILDNYIDLIGQIYIFEDGEMFIGE